MSDQQQQQDEPPRFQFTLWGLMLAITLICICLAIPYGPLLLAALAGWILLAVVIVGLLMLLQAPLYWLLAGKRKPDED